MIIGFHTANGCNAGFAILHPKRLRERIFAAAIKKCRFGT
jgi:hypothetical protein